MRMIKMCLMVAVILLIGVRITQAEEDDRAGDKFLGVTTMPSVDIANRPLEQVLNQIKAKVPGFRFAIFRAPGVPQEFPILQAMTLENVSIDQFLQVICDQYPVDLKNLWDDAGKIGPLCEITIKSGANVRSTTQPSVVRVFGLSDAIALPEILRGNAEVEKRATDDILSLIQAALEVEGEMPAPLLKVHAATHTLIFKGLPGQAEIIANVIAVSHASAKLRSFDTEVSTPLAASKLSTPSTQSQK